MSKKLYALITGITSAVCAGAIVVVTYIAPAHSAAINGSISIVEGAVASICALFMKPSEEDK